LSLSITLKSMCPFRAIKHLRYKDVLGRWFAVRYMDGKEENVKEERLKEILTVDDIHAYLTFVDFPKHADKWIEIEGHPYCDARR
jgi:hypothetical protein